jgi:DNA-binding NtrC family response regulator
MPVTARTVLIVDDDALLRSSLETILASVGYRVLSTGDPDTAYRLLAAESVAAVLLDVRLPTMSGLALYLALAHRWPHLKGRIALVTGDADAPDVRAWVRRNPCSVIRKPFNFRQISDWLDSVARTAEPTSSAG